MQLLGVGVSVMSHINIGRAGRPRASDKAKRAILPEHPAGLKEFTDLFQKPLRVLRTLRAECSRITPGVPAERTANMRAGYFVRSTSAPIMAALIWSQAAQVQATETLVDKLPPEITIIIDNAKDIAGVYSGIKGTIDAAKAIGQILGIYTPFSQEEAFTELHRRLDALATKLDTQGKALDWKINATLRERRLSTLLTTVVRAERYLKSGMPFDDNTPGVYESEEAVRESGLDTPFLRFFVESVTGQNGTGWKAYIKGPEVDNENQVYDWRLGVPALMQLISLRLMVIAALDPNFTTNRAFQTDLLHYRTVLLSQYKKMTEGVRCNQHLTNSYASYDSPDPYDSYYTVVCADIHTGAWEFSGPFYIEGSFTSEPEWRRFVEINPEEEALRREVLLKMPLFQMRSMIDIVLVCQRRTGPDEGQ